MIIVYTMRTSLLCRLHTAFLAQHRDGRNLTTCFSVPSGFGRLGWLRAVWACLAVLVLTFGLAKVSAAADESDFLPPEQAFRVSGQAVRLPAAAASASTGGELAVQVEVAIARGYYVYHQSIVAESSEMALGPPELPRGKVKFDENFQKNVETHRERLLFRVPVLASAGQPFAVRLTLQGCADAGLCYPPQTAALRIDPQAAVAAAPLSAGDANPGPPAQGEGWAWWGQGDLAGRVLAEGRWAWVLAVFFVLGLLLSLTPCVLPMLPILSSLIVGGGAAASRTRGLLLASAYVLGMATVYTLLGLAAGVAGEGLADVLQSPWALSAYALLLSLFALAMFDVYELRLPGGWAEHLTQRANRLPAGQLLGVLAMGGISALIVSPCVTAPLAGALLFISRSGDLWLGGTALFAMALGMGVPLLLLGASAGHWLPRSGPWMHGVKRLFGVLLLAMALYVLSPLLAIALQMAGLGVLSLLAAALLWPGMAHAPHAHRLRHALGQVAAVSALVIGVSQWLGAVSGGQDLLQPLAHLSRAAPAPSTGAAADSQQAPRFQRVDNLPQLKAALAQAGGKTVMLDFYADWCTSCKEMERLTFRDPDIARRLSSAVLLKADVTAHDEGHRALLREFGLFGPPGTLFFDVQGREQAELRVIGFQSPARFGQTLARAGL